jgi:divalent metal cation (Fe/Co/Zn/Cd) transporter
MEDKKANPLYDKSWLLLDSHRSDALTSGVALCSILGSAAGAPVLDPLGGLAVSFFILQQGLSLSRVAALEMLDKGVDAATRDEIVSVVKPLVNQDITQGGLIGVRNVRAVKSGGEL